MIREDTKYVELNTRRRGIWRLANRMGPLEENLTWVTPPSFDKLIHEDTKYVELNTRRRRVGLVLGKQGRH